VPTLTINPRRLPGATRTIEVVEFWKVVEKVDALGGGLGGMTTLRVWAFLMLNRDPITGIVDIERSDLAQLVGITPARTSRILTALAKARLIRRSRERIPNSRGPGRVVVTIP